MAMSGGIDSTMASLILHESGYEVIGLTMKTWDYSSSGGNKKETGCCSLDAINDARKLAVDCGFPHTILDIRDEFGDYIIDNFVEEYIAGRTPNPCVLCNTHIKWEALLKRADMLGCKYIATGHYAQVRYENSRYVVSKGLDNNKDQSYVLWGVKQECLARTIFPMGGYHKEDIKKIDAIKNSNLNWEDEIEIDLYTAIALAIKNNKELRVKLLENALSERQINKVKFEMLPQLAANAGYSGSDYFKATTSANVTADADKGDIGAVKVGSLSRKFDVMVDPYFPRNVVLVGRKGSSFLESGYVYAPYVPLQTTPTIFGPEDFVPRKGVMTRYAKKMVRPDMYGLVIVRGLLGESGS